MISFLSNLPSKKEKEEKSKKRKESKDNKDNNNTNNISNNNNLFNINIGNLDGQEIEEIDISLNHKSFFNSETCLGGNFIDISSIRDSKKGFLRHWLKIYPTKSFKKKNNSPINNKDNSANKYLLDCEPIAELLLNMEMVFSDEERKEYIKSLHEQVYNLISQKIVALKEGTYSQKEEEESDNEALTLQNDFVSSKDAISFSSFREEIKKKNKAEKENTMPEIDGYDQHLGSKESSMDMKYLVRSYKEEKKKVFNPSLFTNNLKNSVNVEFRKDEEDVPKDKTINFFNGKSNDLIKFESNMTTLLQSSNSLPKLTLTSFDFDEEGEGDHGDGYEKYIGVSISGSESDFKNVLSSGSDDIVLQKSFDNNLIPLGSFKKKQFFDSTSDLLPFRSNSFIREEEEDNQTTEVSETEKDNSNNNNKMNTERGSESNNSLDNFGEESENSFFMKPTVTVSEEIKEVKNLFEKKDPPLLKRKAKIVRKTIHNEEEDSLQVHSFNERFQIAVEKIRSTKMSKIGDFSNQLINVAQDFLWSAKTYGKIIISEFALPEKHKTIKPFQGTKGKLGGMKYFHQGIFYKLAEADGKIITKTENASKIAGHELKGCSSYYNTSINGLSFPLLACIDYRGFRLIAITILPINESTLVIGSCDGGRVIKNESKELALKLKKAARMLNIKPHDVSGKIMYSACDLEGHKTTDERFYLLDFSRVMPPQAPMGNEDIFFKLLRPEFVAKYHKPLSSDAFSGFRGKDSAENNLEVKLATEDMLKSIPAFARELSELVDSEVEGNWPNIMLFHNRLPRVIHQAGINMRHLGILYDNGTNYNCKMLLLVEIAARTIKHKLREKMRSHMKQYQHPTEHHYISLVIQYLNNVFTSTDLWQDITDSALKYFKMSPFDTVKKHKEEYELRKQYLQSPEKFKKNKRNTSLSKEDLLIPGNNPKSRKNSKQRILTKDDSEVEIMKKHEGNLSQEEQKDKLLNLKKEFKRWGFKLGSLSPRWRVNNKITGEKSSNDEEGCEDQTPLDLLLHIRLYGGGIALMFMRIVKMMGFIFSERVMGQFTSSIQTRSHPKILQSKNCFDQSDLESLGERVRHMNIVAQAQAIIFFHRAKQETTPATILHFYRLAIEKLEEALDANPTSKVTLMTYAEILLEMQIATTQQNTFSLQNPEIEKINQYYELAMRYDPNDSVILGSYARFLSKCGEYDRAKVHYLNSIYFDFTRSWPVERYASLLSDLGEKLEANQFYSLWNQFISLLKSKTNIRRSGSYLKPSNKSQLI